MKSISLLFLTLALTRGAWARAPLAVIPAGKPGEHAPPTITIKTEDEVVARVSLGYDRDALYLRFRVEDASPLKNGGDNTQLLFKTGDSVDLQLGLNPESDPARTKPVAGDIRVLMTRMGKDLIAVCYRYVVPGTREPVIFASPTGCITVDKVEVMAKATLAVCEEPGGYTLCVALPWRALGGGAWAPGPGTRLRGDVGGLFSDPDGGVTVVRLYRTNAKTAILADIPSEITLPVAEWGAFTLGKAGEKNG